MFLHFWRSNDLAACTFHISNTKTRTYVAILLMLLVPVGLGTKFYHGPAAIWVHHYAGDIFYPMFWYFLGLLFFPRTNALVMGLTVFIFSTAIEFTQLFDGWLLQWLRQFFLGRTLVGVSFSPIDIVYYLIGSLLAVFVHFMIYRNVPGHQGAKGKK